METVDELRAYLNIVTEDDAWNKLLYRGAAWALMRVDGGLPPDAPHFGKTIETDLAEYGFSVLRAALALREVDGQSELASKSFEKAADAFAALVRNGSPDAVERGFYRLIAGAAYHLAGFSAVAFSIVKELKDDSNNSPAEMAIKWLILRDLNQLKGYVRHWILNENYGDMNLARSLDSGHLESDDAVATILNTTICRALAYFDFALQTGDAQLFKETQNLLIGATSLAKNAENIPLWWICKICCALIDDLRSHSLHVNLPLTPPNGSEGKFLKLRRMFISSLYARKIAEVELWPSQREAAKRAADLSDDLVVALPTSAGKTRIAEIASLMTLSTGRRILIVTPLRALSAQTERSFRKTFTPLGFRVSSLYGASGVSVGDESALRTYEIVIATPEKLDFALRSDPRLIDDIGLIVLDEGHMIGPSEREIRYETLVQRLLRRADAGQRRIICLSAILPGGEQLNDLTAWIRDGELGTPIRLEWRPTRQRYGALQWQGNFAKLICRDGSFITKFVEQMNPIGRDRNPYPTNNRDLTLQAAWAFAEQGKRTLVFCTQANWVEGYGKRIIEIFKKNHRPLLEKAYLPSLLVDKSSIARALEVGQEWLGIRRPAVECLKVGVALHHGRLPPPFLRELETLLSEDVLKVIVASPTLAQGLNLNVAVLLIPSLYRAGTPITAEEFSNVAGRVGRAFVDVEGLIVHVMFDEFEQRMPEWKALVASSKARILKSGLIRLINEIIKRLIKEGVLERPDAFEYLANSRKAWSSSSVEEANQEESLSHLVEKLDTVVFGLIEALDADSPDLPRLLDEVLKSSLWARQIVNEPKGTEAKHRTILKARANLIWKNTDANARKGHFAMGVGLEAGLSIDAMATELEELLDRADSASLSGEVDELADALCNLAERLLIIRPFVPDRKNTLHKDWQKLLKQWVSGVEVDKIGTDSMGIIEDAFAYRLVWALEAIKVRRMSYGRALEPLRSNGYASAALETGVPDFRMALLIRAGLPSRRAAISAIQKANLSFTTLEGLREWLTSEKCKSLTEKGIWPTSETAPLWKRFMEEIRGDRIQAWSITEDQLTLDLPNDVQYPQPGIYRIEIESDTSSTAWLTTPDFQRIAKFKESLHNRNSILRFGRVFDHSSLVSVCQIGPEGV